MSGINRPCGIANDLKALGSVGIAENPRLKEGYDLLLKWQRDDGGWVWTKHLEERFKTRSCPYATHNAAMALHYHMGLRNPDLSKGLKLQMRWWNGPIELPIVELTRCVGPEPGKTYAIREALWCERTRKMADSMKDALSIPPLIVEYRQKEPTVCDGNTRCGAMEALGWQSCWVIIWYNSNADFTKHSRHLTGSGWLPGNVPM